MELHHNDTIVNAWITSCESGNCSWEEALVGMVKALASVVGKLRSDLERDLCERVPVTFIIRNPVGRVPPVYMPEPPRGEP